MIIKTNITIPFLALCVFVLLRPIFTISYFDSNILFGLKYIELFSIIVSYGFIILILINLKQQTFDSTSILLLLFCLYCGLSVMWGSNVREVSRLILPAVVFFVTRVSLEEERQLEALILLSIFGYIVPVLASTYSIISDSMSITMYWTGLKRYFGIYSGVHGLAHSMFIFIFISLLYLYFSKKLDRRRIFLFILCFLCLMALFNLVKTYTRTVFIGFYILLFSYFVGRQQYKLLAVIIVGSIFVAITSSTFWDMIYDFVYAYQGKRDLAYIGSGRVSIWSNAIAEFSQMWFPTKVLGKGLKAGEIGASHNDFLSLLLNLGIVGLFMYFSFMCKVFYDIVKSYIDRPLKYIFMGFVLAVFVMNFASNSYVTRVELAQYFFFFTGAFYALKDRLIRKNQV